MTTWTDIVAKVDRSETLTDAEVRKALAYADRTLDDAAKIARHHGDQEAIDQVRIARQMWRLIARLRGKRLHRA
jgi:hypothetical protein